MKITWMGHSAFQIFTDKGLNILIDPFITENPVCPFNLEQIEADIILVTHGHTDHFGDTIEIARKHDSLIICNHEHSVYLSGQGLEAIGMNLGGTITEKGITVTMVNANHSSDMDFIQGIGPGGSSCGYIIKLENGRKIYHSGDTGIFGDMKSVVRDIYQPDLAMLPIGDRYTMGPHEASIAVKWLEVEKVIPMHYNTFPVIEQDPQKFKKEVESSSDVEVVILEPGENYRE
jgi:L-ascorbate metabolism protein UlaG (beta-lactamase superfamily)